MTSLPIDRIYALRNQIHENVLQVHANRTQCERLCERIDQLIEPLERLEHASSSLVRDETRPILDRLLLCIDDCNTYMEKLKSPEGWYEEIYEYKKCEEKFLEFNQRLSQLGQDLCLGLNIQQLFDRKQDQDDQREDLKDLNKKIDEISQKMLEKQCEQYKLIDKMLDKRFQSFRFSFTQNLLMQQNSFQSHERLDEQQQFLHIPYKDLYIEDKSLGNGGFADVYKATWLTHHDQVAVKIIRINHLSSVREDFLREISTMYRIRYENVLSVLGACVEPNFYAIVVEYMPLGSLYDIIHKNHQHITFDWSDRYSLAWQMAKSINYLHNLNPPILHRDIKSMNFLLKYNGSINQRYVVKVCDFGLAEIRRETSLQSASFPAVQLVGSFYWKAPELLLPQGRHTKQSDVYSLGIVYWELATGRKPWDEFDDETIILIQVKIGERPTIPSEIPEQYQQLIQDAWNHDPQKRATCFQLMERSYKEINQPTISIDQKDIIDLHSSDHLLEENYLINSTTKTDSTRTAIQVAEDDNEEQRLTNSLRSSIISEPLAIEDRNNEQTSVDHSEMIGTSEPITTDNETTMIKTEFLLKSIGFSPSIINNEQPNQTFSASIDDLTTDLPTNIQPFDLTHIPMYRIEKRRPLHSKRIWNIKNQEH